MHLDPAWDARPDHSPIPFLWSLWPAPALVLQVTKHGGAVGAAVCIPPSLVGNPARHSPQVALRQCCDGRAPLGWLTVLQPLALPSLQKGLLPGCHWAQVRLANTKRPPASPVQASDGVAEGAAPEVQLGPAPALGPRPGGRQTLRVFMFP